MKPRSKEEWDVAVDALCAGCASWLATSLPSVEQVVVGSSGGVGQGCALARDAVRRYRRRMADRRRRQRKKREAAP